MATPVYQKARRHLSRRDPVLRDLMRKIGPCSLKPDCGDPFPLLVRSIVAQMISTKAALAVYGKLASTLGRVTPKNVLAAGHDALRGAGLSNAKARCLRELAERAANGALPLKRIAVMSDEEITEALLPIPGVGVWTIEMFLIFGLGRLDVLPVADLGLRAGVRDTYGLVELPNVKELTALAEPWRPYRTVATWYFWRSRNPVPQSE